VAAVLLEAVVRELEAHTDTWGAPAYDKRLSEVRAWEMPFGEAAS